jgi:hypothetical protein
LRRGQRMSKRSGVDIAVVIGRTLAVCAHPWAAWRVSAGSGRALVVAAYFVAAFLTTLSALLVLSPAISF